MLRFCAQIAVTDALEFSFPPFPLHSLLSISFLMCCMSGRLSAVAEAVGSASRQQLHFPVLTSGGHQMPLDCLVEKAQTAGQCPCWGCDPAARQRWSLRGKTHRLTATKARAAVPRASFTTQARPRVVWAPRKLPPAQAPQAGWIQALVQGPDFRDFCPASRAGHPPGAPPTSVS